MVFNLTRCDPYHAVINSKELCCCADGASAFKVYFIDIIGRAKPERYEWGRSGMKRSDFTARLARTTDVEGVGFVTAFPHIAKVFRYGPESENVLNVRAWNPRDMTPLDLARGDGYVEFACLAEAAIAAEEYVFWAESETVEGYLTQWSAFIDGQIGSGDKLMKYWKE